MSGWFCEQATYQHPKAQAINVKSRLQMKVTNEQGIVYNRARDKGCANANRASA